MKRIILIPIVLIVFCFTTKAQFHIGLTAGMNFSDTRQSELFPSRPEIFHSPVMGGVFEYDFSEYLHLKAEPIYIEKGVRSGEVQIENRNAEVSLNLSYLEIPLYLKYSSGDNIKPYMFAGPVAGIKLTSAVSGAFSGFEITTDVDEVVNSLEFGIHLGGGIDYKIDEYVTIFMEAKYAFGLSDVIKKGKFDMSFAGERVNGDIPGGTKYFNRGLQIMFGFTFPLVFK